MVSGQVPVCEVTVIGPSLRPHTRSFVVVGTRYGCTISGGPSAGTLVFPSSFLYDEDRVVASDDGVPSRVAPVGVVTVTCDILWYTTDFF